MCVCELKDFVSVKMRNVYILLHPFTDQWVNGERAKNDCRHFDFTYILNAKEMFISQSV